MRKTVYNKGTTQEERMNVMSFNETRYEMEKQLLEEIGSEKKFLTFKKLLKILELSALLNG